MFNKHNLKFSVISILLTLNLNIGTLAMFPSDEHKISESIYGLEFKEKLPITRVGNGNSYKFMPIETISDYKLNNCIKILMDAGIIQGPTSKALVRWFKHLYCMIIEDYNCPSYDFIEKIKSIPKFVDQSGENKHCPYCNEIIKDNKYCTDEDCISYWNLMYSGFRDFTKSKSLGSKSGWRERLCLLPVILLEICKETNTYPPAKAWAVHQLMEGKKINWEYVDNLYNGLAYSITRVPKIKELLNSAYESINMDDVIDASLYYENFQ